MISHLWTQKSAFDVTERIPIWIFLRLTHLYQEEYQTLLLLFPTKPKDGVTTSCGRRFSVSPNRQRLLKRDTDSFAHSFHSREREPIEGNKSLFDGIRKAIPVSSDNLLIRTQ